MAFPACRQLLPSGLATDGGTLVHAYEYERADERFFARPLERLS